MSTKNQKKERSIAVASEESQTWQVIRNHLQMLDKSERAAIHTLEILEAKRKAYLERCQNEQNVSVKLTENQDLLREMYQQLDSQYEEELQEAAKALEKVEVLIGLREETSLDGTGRRKKRKIDAGISISSSASPPPVLVTPSTERVASPISNSRDEISMPMTLAPPTSEKDKKRSNSKSNGSSNHTPAATPRRGTVTNSSVKDVSSISSMAASAQGNKDSKDSALTSTSSSSTYVDPAKARREVLAHQLPLQKGRKVAFRLPSKTKTGPGAANISSMTSRSASSAASGGVNNVASLTQEEDGEVWIMATIIECINNDRNRYVVVDLEDAQKPTYNTTLKAIVPLPESLVTLPIEDYKVGSQILGLYPDTSCFYQATVRGGGPGLNGKILAKMQRRAEEMLNTPYRLEFEDDGGLIHNVPACFVVERP